MASQQWQMQALNALRTLWITLPLRGITDEQGTLDAYGFALEPFSIEAIQNTINALRRGEVEGASTQWCPRPPELASYVRAEQKRLDALNRRPAIAYTPVDKPYVDWRIIHITKALDERRAFVAHIELGSRNSKARAGYTFYWSLGPPNCLIGSLYGPIGSASSDSEVWGQNWACLPESIKQQFPTPEFVRGEAA